MDFPTSTPGQPAAETTAPTRERPGFDRARAVLASSMANADYSAAEVCRYLGYGDASTAARAIRTVRGIPRPDVLRRRTPAED